MQKKKPVYLDIPNIRLPIPGIVSILHRVSGLGLFIGLPIFLWLFSGTLNKEESFDAYQAFVSHPLVKLILLGFLWAYVHHAFAGTRFLFLDAHKGLDLQTARKTATVVGVSAVVVTVVMGVLLW